MQEKYSCLSGLIKRNISKVSNSAGRYNNLRYCHRKIIVTTCGYIINSDTIATGQQIIYHKRPVWLCSCFIRIIIIKGSNACFVGSRYKNSTYKTIMLGSQPAAIASCNVILNRSRLDLILCNRTVF